MRVSARRSLWRFSTRFSWSRWTQPFFGIPSRIPAPDFNLTKRLCSSINSEDESEIHFSSRIFECTWSASCIRSVTCGSTASRLAYVLIISDWNGCHKFKFCETVDELMPYPFRMNFIDSSASKIPSSGRYLAKCNWAWSRRAVSTRSAAFIEASLMKFRSSAFDNIPAETSDLWASLVSRRISA